MTAAGTATVLQVAGAALILYGLGSTWWRYAPDSGFRRAGRSLRSWLQRHIGSKPAPQAHAVFATDVGRFTDGAVVDRDPGTDAPTGAQVAWLRTEVVRLTERIRSGEVREAAEIASVRAEQGASVSAARADLELVRAGLPRVALDGFAWAAGGAALTLVGLLVGAFA